ncbi:MAG: response regulator [Candidatus Omnitrophota bacterium]|nr:response regulator [Candidatus Omnitrophota bacterium]
MPKLTILLADDEKDFLTMLAMRLKAWGYEVIVAEEGAEAVRLVRDKKPDVVIIDYMMPEMDGVAALREIRKTNADVPVIMLTAYPDKHSIKGAETLDVLAYIPKVSAHSDTQALLRSALRMAERAIGKGKADSV